MPLIMAACQPWPTQCLDEGKCTVTEHSSGCLLPVAPWGLKSWGECWVDSETAKYCSCPQATNKPSGPENTVGITHFLDSKAAIERQIFQHGTLQVCKELSLTKCMDQEIDPVSSNGEG